MLKRSFTVVMADCDSGLILGQSRKSLSPDEYNTLNTWLSSWLSSFMRGSRDDSRDIVLQITCRNELEEIKLPF